MKIVRFNDGTYAVRRGWGIFGYDYFDNQSGDLTPSQWWSEKYIRNAKVKTLEEAKKLLVLAGTDDKGTPLKGVCDDCYVPGGICECCGQEFSASSYNNDGRSFGD